MKERLSRFYVVLSFPILFFVFLLNFVLVCSPVRLTIRRCCLFDDLIYWDSCMIFAIVNF